jgi:DNA-binding CsgD family transcriptional regulator
LMPAGRCRTIGPEPSRERRLSETHLPQEIPLDIPDSEFVAWLRALGPSYGFRDPMMLSRGPAGGVTVVAVLDGREAGHEGGALHERLERLVDDAQRRAECSRKPAPPSPFTPAELEVLTWLRLGRTNREIGKILFKSEFTVKTHVQRMLSKTGLDNRLQLAALRLQPR